MNTSTLRDESLDRDRLEAQVAARMAAVMSASLAELPADVQARLRFAREQAVQRRAGPAVAGRTAGGAAVLGRLAPWWPRLGALLPVAAVAAGVLMIDAHRQREAVTVASEIDSALLVDELPPQAYADPGFVAFLKLRQP